MHTRADGIDRNDMPLLIRSVYADEPRDQELAPVKTLVFARGHHGSNYSSKNHV
jgi:hypothetical protein